MHHNVKFQILTPTDNDSLPGGIAHHKTLTFLPQLWLHKTAHRIFSGNGITNLGIVEVENQSPLHGYFPWYLIWISISVKRWFFCHMPTLFISKWLQWRNPVWLLLFPWCWTKEIALSIRQRERWHSNSVKVCHGQIIANSLSVNSCQTLGSSAFLSKVFFPTPPILI